MNHASTIVGELLVSLYNGCYTFLNNKLPSFATIIQKISNENITILFTVPSFLDNLLSLRNNDALRSLRIVNFYGDKLNCDMAQIIHYYPNIDFIYSYGLTEASPRVTYIDSAGMLSKPNSSGKPIDNVDVLIYEGDRAITNGETGEIVVKGPNVMAGYYKNEELTIKKLKNQLLFTGDMGYIDHEGYLFVVGRFDNMFIKNGRNIYPEEIENIIKINFSNIENVLVRAEKAHNGLEILCFIQPLENMKIEKREIYSKLRFALDDFKMPDEIYYIKNFALTGSGKIIRNQNFQEEDFINE
jgi:long-chain acyl-CoA synthetase